MAQSRTLIALAVILASLILPRADAQANQSSCTAQKDDVAGCQPGPFDPPLALMPTSRVGASGQIDRRSSDKDAMKGARLLEEKLGLFRNFIHVHWVPLLPSVTDSATGVKSGGDLDADGDGRGLTLSGRCIFVGHGNHGHGATDTHPVDILRLADDPARNAPAKIGEIPQTGPGVDDTMFGASLFKKADGKESMILIRDTDSAAMKGDGVLYVYTIDPATCLVTNAAEPYRFGGDFHELGVWHDPDNEKRILIVTSAWNGAALPDPQRPGVLTPDLRVIAVTDETTGEMLPKPITLGTFTLQNVGGPVKDEQPDGTGLYSDGRFPDYGGLKDRAGQPVMAMKSQGNYLHQATMSRDGERIYIAGSSAGFYILNSEAVAHGKDKDLAAGKAGCRMDSTNIYMNNVIGGQVDKTKLAQVASDCLHMVVNDDPGVKAIIGAGNLGAYFALLDRSRWDPYPSMQAVLNGIHSAIAVPDRPSLDRNNVKGRPGLLVATEEALFCPTSSLFILSIEAEITPVVIGTFGIPFNDIERCLQQPIAEPNGEPRKPIYWQAHDPTVFKNLVFVSWYGQGVRALDISNPRNPREVGHANTIPLGMPRSYPIYKDGLFYWTDNRTGLHVARYTGPRAEELPKPGDGMIYEGNAIPHH